MDIELVKKLMRSFRLRDLRRELFPQSRDKSSVVQYLDYGLLQNLSSLMPLGPENGGDNAGDRRDLMYTIIEFERFNRPPDEFTAILHSALLTAARAGDALVVEVMIHSGGNLFYPMGADHTDNESLAESLPPLPTKTLYDVLSEMPAMVDVIDLYFPGVWNCVETGNIQDLRRLVNCWCSTDLHLNGESLLQMAHRIACEPVIRLVAGSHVTLKLIHAFLAGNEPEVRQLMTRYPPIYPSVSPLTGLSEYGINLDFRHLADNGPPLLYYVIERNEVWMARLMLTQGAKLYIGIRVPEKSTVKSGEKEKGDGREELIDVPVLYAALTNPNLDPEMMSALLSQDDQLDHHSNPQAPKQLPELLYRMMFMGKNCVEVAMAHSLNLPAFKVLVQKAGAKILSERNESCQTVRDIAVAAGHEDYVAAIDEVVMQMLQRPEKHAHQRQLVALFGYDLSDLLMHEPPVDAFYSLFPEYQSQVRKLGQAIVDGDTVAFSSLVWWTKEDTVIEKTESDEQKEGESASKVVVKTDALFERLLVWDGREGQSNPLPLLHRAVIHQRTDIVRMILELKPVGQSIDFLLDNYRRTALHYAEARPEWQEVRDLLRDYGSSDHTVDRDGREPLDFKLVQKKKSTGRLIERLRFSDFSSPEPNPFRIQDLMKHESGEDLYYRHRRRHRIAGLEQEKDELFDGVEGAYDETSDGEEDEEDDDDDDDEAGDGEDDEAEKQGSGLWHYLSSCSVM